MSNSVSRFCLFSSLLISLGAGCTVAQRDDQGSVGVQDLTTSRDGNDVTVLVGRLGETIGRMYPDGQKLGDRALDLSRCEDTDCTSAAQELLDATLVGDFSYDAASSGACETIEFTTLTKRAAFDAPTFRGIGFYVSSQGMSFVSKETLLARGDSGEVTLKDGSRAIAHRFVAQGMCFGLGGNGGAIARRTYEWKPYARFDAGGDTYRIWDGVRRNYFLGRVDGSLSAGFVSSFDRTRELLRP